MSALSSINHMPTAEGIVAREPSTSADLLPLAVARPRDALSAARALLSRRPPPHDASIAHQAAAIVLRDRGEVGAAVRELRRALALAERTGDPDRSADVLATLGIALAWTGQSGAALDAFDRAVGQARGALAGRILMRRAVVYRMLGRYDDALVDLSRALVPLRRARDEVWELRTLTHRGWVNLLVGRTERAAADFSAVAAALVDRTDELEYAVACHNLGLVAIAQGNLPAALGQLRNAGERYDRLGSVSPELAVDRCAALLAAGLAADALREADAAVALLPTRGADASKRAELRFAGAAAALAADDWAQARVRAAAALRDFRAHGRRLWAARAELVLVQAQFSAGDRSAALLARIDRVAAELDDLRAEERPRAHLLAGRLALRRGAAADASRHLGVAARARRRGPALSRSVGWLAVALQAESVGNRRATLSACRRGLAALDEHRRTLGATEMRAYATAHGAELAAVAQRDAIAHADARRLLIYTERWRATALVAAAGPRTVDDAAATELAALRSVSRALETARADGGATGVLEVQRRRLEDAVRSRALVTPGGHQDPAAGFDLELLLEALGDTRLIQLVGVDGVLHAITVAGRRVRQHAVGRLDDQDVVGARTALTRLAYGNAPRHMAAMLDQIGRRLERSLLGAAVGDLGDGPVVVVPPARLHAVPWSLLPCLRNRVVSVAPSAVTWMRSGRNRPPAAERVTLVVGPGLGSGGAEVPVLARSYPGATVLTGDNATAGRVLPALEGAWLAHVAAHGDFRADNPLFSSLRLADGPLTVYDLEQLTRAPYRLVLSSCDSGVAAPVGADELLGLVSSLMPLGAGGILASVVPVNDAATVPLMVALHERLRAGATLPQALLGARSSLDDDPVAVATGLAFLAFGT